MGINRAGVDPVTDRVEGLFRDHGASLRRYALRRVGHDGADDIVQAVFLVAVRRIEQMPETSLAWLYGIAWNEILKERTARGRLAQLQSRLQAQPPLAIGDADGAVVGQMWAEQFLRSLRPADAELLRLVVWDDLDVVDAAGIVGMRPGTAHVRLHRLRRRIAASIRAGGGPWTDRANAEGTASEVER